MTVYVCVHMPRECVCERKDVHAYCSKMLAAQQKQDYALAELWGGGGGGLCKVESLKSAEKWQCSSVFKMESRKLPPCSTEAMVGRPKDRQRELRPDKVHCRAVRLGTLVSKARCQPLDEVLPFTLQNSVRGDDEGSEIRSALPASFLVLVLFCSCQAVKNCCHVAVDV